MCDYNLKFFELTGLKDLADFLPASLATIVSYFSAEVSRGIWRPVYMNGTDWPSPAANLSNVEEKIKKILAATGVDVPSLAAGIILLPLHFLYACEVIVILRSLHVQKMKRKGRATENCPSEFSHIQMVQSCDVHIIMII